MGYIGEILVFDADAMDEHYSEFVKYLFTYSDHSFYEKEWKGERFYMANNPYHDLSRRHVDVDQEYKEFLEFQDKKEFGWFKEDEFDTRLQEFYDKCYIDRLVLE